MKAAHPPPVPKGEHGQAPPTASHPVRQHHQLAAAGLKEPKK